MDSLLAVARYTSDLFILGIGLRVGWAVLTLK